MTYVALEFNRQGSKEQTFSDEIHFAAKLKKAAPHGNMEHGTWNNSKTVKRHKGGRKGVFTLRSQPNSTQAGLTMLGNT